ncbi:MAG: AbrB/MazE/SpoVT family DNA-binding domain-containing protein [Promethearchaeia archaeon]
MKSLKKTISKVGSKGEIFPPKEIRQQLGLNPNQPIIMDVQGDKLIIRKLHSIEEILSTPTKVKISYHAWKQFKKKLSEEAEK